MNGGSADAARDRSPASKAAAPSGRHGRSGGADGRRGGPGVLARQLGGLRRISRGPRIRAAGAPRGGRRIFPGFQVVAFYGAPQDHELGALGVGSPRVAGRRLVRQARAYNRGGRPVLPAFELIATVVHAAPGQDGDYSQRQTRSYRRSLPAGRARPAGPTHPRHPARPSLVHARGASLWHFLEQPDVSLALDPEWSMAPGQLPGQEIGSTDAAAVNEVSRSCPHRSQARPAAEAARGAPIYPLG